MTVDFVAEQDTTQQGDTQSQPRTEAPAHDSTQDTESPREQADQSDTQDADEPAKPKRGRPKSSTPRKTRTVELTLTVAGTADGEWQAELKHGSKWVAKGLEIPASAVSRAAKELHAELSGPIDEVINEAKQQQQAKVAQLEAELERAKQALADLQS